MLGGFRVHYLLLVASLAFAYFIWAKGRPPVGEQARGDIIVWTGRAEDIERIVFERPNGKTTLEAKHDAQGTYFQGTYERVVEPNEQLTRPDHSEPYVNETGAKQTLSQMFISTTAALKLASDLAPLKALRAVGRVPRDKLSEFGLDAPTQRAIVKFRNAQHTLEWGDETTGEADQYVLDREKNEVYVLLGDLARTIAEADVRLPNQELHEWADTTPTSATISGSAGKRNLVRGGQSGNLFWADRANSAQKDETLTNYMAKIDHLRSILFDPSPPSGRTMLFRIEYAGHGSPMGYMEFWKGTTENQVQYWVVTERTRVPAKVNPGEGEQLERDTGTILK